MLALPVACKAQVTNLRYQLRARRRLQTYATNCAPDAGYKPTLPMLGAGNKPTQAQVTNLRYQDVYRCRRRRRLQTYATGRVQGAGYKPNATQPVACKAQDGNLGYQSRARRLLLGLYWDEAVLLQ